MTSDIIASTMKVFPNIGALLLLLAIQDSICFGTGAVAGAHYQITDAVATILGSDG